MKNIWITDLAKEIVAKTISLARNRSLYFIDNLAYLNRSFK